MYQWQECDKLEYLICKEKEYDIIITEAKWMIKACLDCPYNKECDEKIRLVKDFDNLNYVL